ncbi:MAG: hypothetical protein OEY78_13310 [Gammaproteobacteria bacterium]|nr:hypothetical protein [Gammaproteobacteria bacterium]
MRILLSVIFVSAFTFNAYASSGEMSNEYNMALSEAKSAYDKAKKYNFAWSETKEMIKKSEDSAKAGDMEKAISIAKAAKRQSENAYQQYISQKDVKPRLN